MNNSSLLEALSSRPDKPRDWVESLEARKREEIDFHNEHHSEVGDANQRFYAIAHAEGGGSDYLYQWLKTAPVGKTFLDYACGNGGCAIAAAKAGCELAVGIDISDVSVGNARRNAERENVRNTYFVQADCENTGLPDNSFDCILCSGMLHHLDLDRAIPELKRILKPGGVVLAVEALNYNPAIKLYRKMTPQFRTRWETEHIIDHKKIDFIRPYLRVDNIRYFHLVNLLTIPFIGTRAFTTVHRLTTGIDRLVLRIPGLRLMAWMIVFEMHKD